MVVSYQFSVVREMVVNSQCPLSVALTGELNDSTPKSLIACKLFQYMLPLIALNLIRYTKETWTKE